MAGTDRSRDAEREAQLERESALRGEDPRGPTGPVPVTVRRKGVCLHVHVDPAVLGALAGAAAVLVAAVVFAVMRGMRS